MRILRLVQLLGQRGSVRLAEVARELAVSPSAAHRLLATCCEAGFARQDATGGPYQVGPVLHELTLTASRAVVLQQAAANELSKAARKTQETISLVVLEGRNIRFVETVEGTRPVRVSSPLGATMPAHLTAGGRAMLAFLPVDEIARRYPSKVLSPGANGTTLSWDDFARELDRIRARGWALQVGEAAGDIAGIAYPVRDSLGVPRAAVVATVPRSRLMSATEARELAELLKPYVETVQRRLRGG